LWIAALILHLRALGASFHPSQKSAAANGILSFAVLDGIIPTNPTRLLCLCKAHRSPIKWQPETKRSCDAYDVLHNLLLLGCLLWRTDILHRFPLFKCHFDR